MVKQNYVHHFKLTEGKRKIVFFYVSRILKVKKKIFLKLIREVQ